jgi:uracil-DNA glycosylase family 4
MIQYLEGQSDLPLMFAEQVQGNPKCTACRRHKNAEDVCVLNPWRDTDTMVIGTSPDDGPRVEMGHLLKKVGLNPVKMFWASAVACKGDSPTKGEIKACAQWVRYQIRQVKPKYVLLVGNAALQSITGSAGIKKQRGRPFEKDGITYLAMYSPGITDYDPSAQGLLDNDLRLFKDIVQGEGIPREKALNNIIVRTRADFRAMLKDLKGTVSFDIETNSLYPWQTHNDKGEPEPAKIIAIGFGTAKRQYTIPFHHHESPFNERALADMVEELDEVLQDVYLVTHNGKFDCLWMMVHHGVFWHDLMAFDTMLAHYLLDENARHGLKELAQKFCGAPNWDVDKATKTGKESLEQLAIYHAHDLYYTRQLRFIFGRMLKKDMQVNRVFHKLMMPVATLFTEIEYDGIFVEEHKFEEAEAYLKGELASALKTLKDFEPRLWHKDAKGKNKEFSWGSSKDLAAFFFGKKTEHGLGLAIVEKTKKGGISVNESVLKRLDHPAVEALLKYRGAKQQLSFFIEGWKPFLHRTDTGVYLHPSFKLHGTVTGRPSCEHPNLQQVPRDKRIRSLISAPKGWVLIDADLSQIELRIAAELAQEETLLRVFNAGGDPHWTTCLGEIARGGAEAELVVATAHKYLKRKKPEAKKPSYSDAIDILGTMTADDAVGIDERWKELRKKAKAVNFGYLYGMWWKKFKAYARDNYGVSVTDEEAEASRSGFFATYSGFPRWHERQKRYARRNGFVRTMSGRVRRLPDAMAKEDSFQRGAAERQAINAPVQGFAAELNLMVALQLRKEYTRKQLRIVGTVHDAILMWAREDMAVEIARRTCEIMRRPDLFDDFEVELDVPIEGEAKIGAWSEGISIDKWEKQYAPRRVQSDRSPRRQQRGRSKIAA